MQPPMNIYNGKTPGTNMNVNMEDNAVTVLEDGSTWSAALKVASTSPNKQTERTGVDAYVENKLKHIVKSVDVTDNKAMKKFMAGLHNRCRTCFRHKEFWSSLRQRSEGALEDTIDMIMSSAPMTALLENKLDGKGNVVLGLTELSDNFDEHVMVHTNPGERQLLAPNWAKVYDVFLSLMLRDVEVIGWLDGPTCYSLTK